MKITPCTTHGQPMKIVPCTTHDVMDLFMSLCLNALQSSPPPLCASGRSNDIDALLNVINTAEKFIYIAVMDYAPAVVFAPKK